MIMKKRKNKYTWNNYMPSMTDISKDRHKLHKLIYNNENKVNKFDKDMFEQLKQMIKSKDSNDRKIALGLVTNGKFTPKQATYLVYNCHEMMQPDYILGIDYIDTVHQYTSHSISYYKFNQ